MAIMCIAIWITFDEGSEQVLEYYSNYFNYHLSNTRPRWKAVLLASWRPFVLALFSLICTILALMFYRANALGYSSPARIFIFFAMSFSSCLAFAWIRANRNRRIWNRARFAISELSHVMECLESDSEIHKKLEVADCECLEPWRAWHPPMEEYRNPGWSPLIPIVYNNQIDSVGVLQMSSMNIFLLRTNPKEIESFQKFLPFDGLSDTKYEIIRSGPIWRMAGWWYVRVTIHINYSDKDRRITTGDLLPFLRVYVFRYLWTLPIVILVVLIPGQIDNLLLNAVVLIDVLFIFGAASRCLHDYIAGSSVVQFAENRTKLEN